MSVRVLTKIDVQMSCMCVCETEKERESEGGKVLEANTRRANH